MTDLNATLDRNLPHATPGPWTTPLKGASEGLFRTWLAANRVPFDPDEAAPDYDMRGYWKDVASNGVDQTAVNPNDQRVHYPDTYKTPYHESFSSESRYALPSAPSWINDHQLADQDGNVVYDERPGEAPNDR
jgi:hypothetical protein